MPRQRVIKSQMILWLNVFLFVAPPSNAQECDVSTTEAESKSHGIFMRSVKVTPDHFDWEGHNVVVTQCWLEPSTYASDKQYDHLIWRFTVDGGLFQEEKILSKTGKAIILRLVDGKDSDFQPFCTPFWSQSQKWKRIFSKNAEALHFTRVPKHSEANLNLRVGTSDRKAKTRDKYYSMSDHVLTFDLQQ